MHGWACRVERVVTIILYICMVGSAGLKSCNYYIVHMHGWVCRVERVVTIILYICMVGSAGLKEL